LANMLESSIPRSRSSTRYQHFSGGHLFFYHTVLNTNTSAQVRFSVLTLSQ
jgi:hypothetical protein